MDAFFSPRGIAVVGASREPDRLGHLILRNLLTGGYRGPVSAVNPRADAILGRPCHPDLTSVPERVELVVLAAPAATADDFIADLERRSRERGDVKALVAVTAGFAEAGAEGAGRQARLVNACRRLGVRLVGPNCIGVMDRRTGVNTTFLDLEGLRPGRTALVTQSGALVAWLEGLWREEPSAPALGRLVSLGNAADVEAAEVIAWLGRDAETAAIGLYLEGTGHARGLLDAIAGAAATRPVVVLKAGRSESGSAAARSHTGAMAGPRALWSAGLSQAGAWQAEGPEDFGALLAAAERLWPALAGLDASGRRAPKSRWRVAVVTNAGGPGVIASDLLFGAAGNHPASPLAPATLAAGTEAALRALAPPASAVVREPAYADLTAAATGRQQAAAVMAAASDPGVDVVVWVSLPTPFNPSDAVAAAYLETAASRGGNLAPVVCVLPAGPVQAAGRRVLAEAGVPAMATVAGAARGLRAAAAYRHWLATRGWDRTWRHPAPAGDAGDPGPATGDLVPDWDAALALSGWGVPFPPARLCRTLAEARQAAGAVGYPVALKVVSGDIAHRTDAGLVRLELRGPAALARAWRELRDRVRRHAPGARVRGIMVQAMVPGGVELIVGGLRDPAFGPVISVGVGGIFTEVYRDVAWRLAPVTPGEAREMLEGLRGYPLLTGARGRPPVNLAAVSLVIARASVAVARWPDLRELDLNPVVCTPDGAWAVDALIRVGG